MIPPQELAKRNFSKGSKGYEQTEVDEYISFVIEKYTELFAQCDEYQGKLRLVANRISEMQSEEEAIHKLMISTQKYCDTLKEESKQKASEILNEAREQAQEIISEAEIEEEKILTNAKQTAERALLAISQKAENQIEDSREKSEALLMSARTRCAKILSEFKKEIAVQRNGLINLKAMTDNFNDTIFGLYKEHINSLTENTPELNFDLDDLTESKLFSSLMQDIKKDAIDIAEKNGNKEYDFQEELSALKVDVEIKKEDARTPRSVSNANTGIGSEDDTDSGEVEETEKTTIFTKVPENRSDIKAGTEEDVKVFAGQAASVASVSGADTMIFDKNTINSAMAEQEHSERYSDEAEQYEEETIATYDSDDFSQDEYDAKNANSERENSRNFGSTSGYGSSTQSSAGKDDDDSDDDSYDDRDDYNTNDNDDDEDDEDDDNRRVSNNTRKVGFLGSLFGKKKNNKKKNTSKDDDIEYELDDDDDDDDYDIDLDDL